MAERRMNRRHAEPPPNCCDCGRFIGTGAAWMMVYSGFPKVPDHEVFRCAGCVAANGPFEPQQGIRAEHSCGMVENRKSHEPSPTTPAIPPTTAAGAFDGKHQIRHG